MDRIELRMERTFHREQQLQFQRAEYSRACARKAAGFRERRTIPKAHANAKPHRVARVAKRTALAQDLLQHATDCPTVSLGKVGVRKPTSSRYLRGWCLDTEHAEEVECLRAEDNEPFPPNWECSFPCVDLLACLLPKAKKVSFTSESDSTASDLSCDVPTSEASEGCAVAEVEPTAVEAVAEESVACLEPQAHNKERVLQDLVRGLQQQRDQTAKENVSLRAALEQVSTPVAKPVLEATKTTARPVSLREAKRIACERARKVSREASQQKKRQQELKNELDAAREEAQREASRITSEALLQADALRTKAREVVAMEKLAVSAEMARHEELQHNICDKEEKLRSLAQEETELQRTLRQQRCIAAIELQVAEQKLEAVSEAHSATCAATVQAERELQDTLAALEAAKQQHLSAKIEATETSTSQLLPQVSKPASISLKMAKELERQRTQKEQKKAASVRALQKQKEAMRSQMMAEVEQERVRLLEEARQQALSMTAKAKSQSRVLRQKSRRSARQVPKQSEPADEAIVQQTPQDAREPSSETAPVEVNEPCSAPCQPAAADSEVTEALCGNSVASEVVSEDVSETIDAQNEGRELDWEMLSDMGDEEAAWDLVG
jgi:hypothetical protein